MTRITPGSIGKSVFRGLDEGWTDLGVGQGQFSLREGNREARDKSNFVKIIFGFNESRPKYHIS